MPSPYKIKTTQRKKVSSQDGSITLKGGKYETENVIFSGKEIFDKASDKN